MAEACSKVAERLAVLGGEVKTASKLASTLVKRGQCKGDVSLAFFDEHTREFACSHFSVNFLIMTHCVFCNECAECTAVGDQPSAWVVVALHQHYPVACDDNKSLKQQNASFAMCCRGITEGITIIKEM